MKSFVLAVVIAVLLVGGGILFNITLGDVSESFEEKCGEITEHIKDGNFLGAVSVAENLSEEVKDRKLMLASVLNHEDIDNIEICMAELLEYSKNFDKTEALVRCEKLTHLFEHLPANYNIKAQNIL